MSQNKYEIKRTNQFKKDLKKVMKRECFDAKILDNVVKMLANITKRTQEVEYVKITSTLLTKAYNKYKIKIAMRRR